MKNRIKQLRDIHNLTQDEFAKLVNVSRQTIISLEKGHYNPSITLAFKIAKVFNTTIEHIFLYEEE
ncbi:helix-turn-helix transcriptional regulator [Anaerophilus nitritogenes]|uniref:helix-turn-helix transcriptional regulator n=1 Tax=Anaerophilus nitritogenes TaxID=2498136 RepID=UPI00101BDA18|nr:helix-turn-helix transcriptional regulator [Anaerophilus nitritogenes]